MALLYSRRSLNYGTSMEDCYVVDDSHGIYFQVCCRPVSGVVGLALHGRQVHVVVQQKLGPPRLTAARTVAHNAVHRHTKRT